MQISWQLLLNMAYKSFWVYEYNIVCLLLWKDKVSFSKLLMELPLNLSNQRKDAVDVN